MNVKDLMYRILPDCIVTQLRHYKHLHDLKEVAEPEFPFIREFIHLGDTVVDIGANFGVFTKFFSEAVGPGGRVLAFEPIPTTFYTLQKGIERYKLTNVELFRTAISSQRRKVIMQVPRFPGGGDNLYEATIASQLDEQLVSFEVTADTVDSLRLSRVDFIKIDVEGHEVEVLEGAKNTLARCHPTLLVEVSHPEVAAVLSAIGYGKAIDIAKSNKLFIAATQTDQDPRARTLK